MSKKNLKIVFFGTPEFAVKSLDKLVEAGYDIATVVTMPDKLAGRGHKVLESEVKKYASSKGLPILQPEKLQSQDFVEALRKINADLFIVIAFRMLPEVVWAMPPLGTFNLHASLLPKYRGAAPLNWAIINGETETGVTTFFLKHEIDTGDIIEQKSIEILPQDNVGSIHDKLMELGADMVLETVDNIASSHVVSKPQPEGEFIPAPKIFKETCKIDWSNKSFDIHNLVRGLSPYPSAWTNMHVPSPKCKETNDDSSLQTAKIFKTHPAESISDIKEEPGTLTIVKDRLFVATGDNPIEILEIQPAGKKRMTTAEFLRGYKPIRFL